MPAANIPIQALGPAMLLAPTAQPKPPPASLYTAPEIGVRTVLLSRTGSLLSEAVTVAPSCGSCVDQGVGVVTFSVMGGALPTVTCGRVHR